MGMGWGKEVAGGTGREREGEEGKGVLARAHQQMDKCLFRSLVLCFTVFFFKLIPPPPSAPQPAAHSFAPRVNLCCEMGATILAGTQNLVEALLPSLSYRLPVRACGGQAAQVRRNGFGWVAVMFNQQAVVGGGGVREQGRWIHIPSWI